jgi:hypothetical protein
MKSYSSLSLGFLLLLTSCFWYDEWNQEFINDDYYVEGMGPSLGEERMRDCDLRYLDKEANSGESFIRGPIQAVGNNEDYIIVKRAAVPIEYYIVKIVRSGNRDDADVNVLGPLPSQTFYLKLKQIDPAGTLQFTRQYDANGPRIRTGVSQY